LTVLLLHQTKFQPPVRSQLPSPNINSAAASNVALPHDESTKIQQLPIDSPTRQLPMPNSIHAKALLEQARVGIDLLDGESTRSKSALENTDIETECVIDEAFLHQMSLVSLAQMNAPQKLVFATALSSDFFFELMRPFQAFQDKSSRLLQSNATIESRLREMLLPAQLRDRSFSSPADTPRSPTQSEAAKPLQSTQAGGDDFDVNRSQENQEPSPTALSGRSPKIYEAGGVDDDASQSSSVSHHKSTQAANSSSPQVSARVAVGNSISNRALIPAEVDALHFSPQINAAAAEAAGKAGQLAQEMKNSLGVQKQHARYQAVQAAAAAQSAAQAQHDIAKKIMEAAYDSKVEEAAVLRRDCAKMQEIIESLKVKLDSCGDQRPCEGDRTTQEESFSKLQQHNVALEADIQVTLAAH
jgi:hypothetical protein